MFIADFYVFLFSSITSQINKSIKLVLIFIIGLFASCLNENTSIIVVIITDFIFFGFIGNIISALKLLFSSGYIA